MSCSVNKIKGSLDNNLKKTNCFFLIKNASTKLWKRCRMKVYMFLKYICTHSIYHINYRLDRFWVNWKNGRKMHEVKQVYLGIHLKYRQTAVNFNSSSDDMWLVVLNWHWVEQKREIATPTVVHITISTNSSVFPNSLICWESLKWAVFFLHKRGHPFL